MSRKAAKGKSNQAKLLFRANLKTVEGYITLEASSQPIFLGEILDCLSEAFLRLFRVWNVF